MDRPLDPTRPVATKSGALVLMIVRGQEVDWKPLTAPCRLVIGRDPECDPCVPDPSLSRRHAVLELHADHDFLLKGNRQWPAKAINDSIEETRDTNVRRHALENRDKTFTVRFARAYRERLRNASVWKLELRRLRLDPEQLELDELFYAQGQLTGTRHFRLLR